MPDTPREDSDRPIHPGVTRPANWFVPASPPEPEPEEFAHRGYQGNPYQGNTHQGNTHQGNPRPAPPSFGRIPDLSAGTRRVKVRRRRRFTGLGQLLAGVVVLAALLVTAALVLPSIAKPKGVAASAGRSAASSAAKPGAGSAAGSAARPGAGSAAGPSAPGGNSGVFSQVTTVGSTAVATGTQAGGQPEFFASINGGRSWAQAITHTMAGPAAGHPATLVAGGPGGWTALGPQAIWTSPDGMTWTLDSAHGLGQAGDVVTAVTRTQSGFLATGTNAAEGTGLVWTSANGVSWHRFTAAQFGLADEADEQVFSMNYATTSANHTLIVGAAHEDGKTCWYVWMSGKSDSSWTTVVVPMNHGGGARFAGFGTSSDGFIAVRPGTTAGGLPEAVVYRSSNAVDWRFQGTITDQEGFSPVQVTGSAGAIPGFVIAGRDGQGDLVVNESTDNAATWTRSRSFGQVPAGQSVGVAMLPDGTVVIADTAGGPGQALLETGSQSTTPRPVTLTSKS